MMSLRECRRSRLLSIRGLSERAGVATQTIVSIEGGTRMPHLNTVRKLAAALGVDPMDVAELAAAVRGDRPAAADRDGDEG